MTSLILARGGSKGIPKKNLKSLDGKPLIWYVINAAKKSKKISEIFVSTDDEEISDYVNKLGVNVVARPIELASDYSLDVDSFRHFCNLLKIFTPIVHLRATSPLILPRIIDEAISTFNINQKDITSLRSAHETSESVFKYYKEKNGFWEPIADGLDTTQPRQKYISTYCPNGYVDIVKPTIFMNQETFYGDKIFAYKTEKIHEIDTIEDFEYNEYLIKTNRYVPF